MRRSGSGIVREAAAPTTAPPRPEPVEARGPARIAPKPSDDIRSPFAGERIGLAGGAVPARVPRKHAPGRPGTSPVGHDDPSVRSSLNANAAGATRRPASRKRDPGLSVEASASRESRRGAPGGERVFAGRATRLASVCGPGRTGTDGAPTGAP